MTIDTVAKYLKLQARAEHVGTPDTEAATARKLMAKLAREHEGLETAAKKVSSVIANNGKAGAGPASWRESVETFLARTAAAAAEAGADSLAGELSGARRFDPLKRGEVLLTPHQCASDQVCLEIRVRRKDLVRVRFRDQMLEGVEETLLDLADE